MNTNNKIYAEAVDIISNIDHVLIHERVGTLGSKNLYDFAAKLGHARNLMLVLGDRTYREENKIADIKFDGVL